MKGFRLHVFTIQAECNAGYTLRNKACAETYSCNAGGSGNRCKACVSIPSRTKADHCGQCNAGYTLRNKACAATYSCDAAGTGNRCKACVSTPSRTKNDHCAQC